MRGIKKLIIAVAATGVIAGAIGYWANKPQPPEILPNKHSPAPTYAPAEDPTPAPIEMPVNGITFTAAKEITVTVPFFGQNPSVEVNGNIPFFGEEEKKNTGAFESYGRLDELGRCSTCYANCTGSLMPGRDEARGEIGSVKPSGWQTVKYPEIIEDMFLFNRCHLIMWALTGENANPKNLITGTRYLNTSGMLPYESIVAGYLWSNPENHVLYRVTPVFIADELVCRGVLMEAYSVEDEGEGVQFCIFAYNSQPGVDIDYSTGRSWRNNDAIPTLTPVPTSVPMMNAVTASGENDETELTVILNTNTHKYHIPTCDSVKDIKSKNRREYTGTREWLTENGYSQCKACRP